MDKVLLSSKKMDYCTPMNFFIELDKEFNFALDAAATKASTKCNAYYTPETDGLKSPWNLAGGLCSATLHTEGKLGSGSARHTRRRRMGQPLSCLFQPERTHLTSTTTFTGKRKSVFCEGGYGLKMKMVPLTRLHRFRLW